MTLALRGRAGMLNKSSASPSVGLCAKIQTQEYHGNFLIFEKVVRYLDTFSKLYF